MKTKTFILFFSFLTLVATAQSENEPPYKRFPTLPPLQLLLPDSSTVFSEKQLKKNRPVLVMLFSPDCDHCQKETEELISHIDQFSGIQIVMTTALPFEKMKTFYDINRLDRYRNIIVGWDRYFLLPTFYRIKNYPFLAFYDKKGKLIDVFEGGPPIPVILSYFSK